MNDNNNSSIAFTAKLRPAAAASLLGAAALLLAGCGASTLSRGLTQEGAALEVVFPDPENASKKKGVFPNLENLRNVRPGITKDHVRDLVGVPHFAEGMGTVREWDYIFQFHSASGPTVTTCQYKVLFDDKSLARSLYWKPARCGQVLNTPVETLAAQPAPVQTRAQTPAPPVRHVSLKADGLFAFGKSDAVDLLPEGRRRIEALAVELRREAGAIGAVNITGHTDRLGTAVSNEVLSLARAHTVRNLLAEAGVAMALMQVRGEGSRQPLVVCEDRQNTPALQACLQPNRRVEIEVVGKR